MIDTAVLYNILTEKSTVPISASSFLGFPYLEVQFKKEKLAN